VKAIILAGGSGSRLHPLTLGVSKQMLPVFDKPMIYYPLSTLMLAGLRDVLLITTPRDEAAFSSLLGDGSHLGINISYSVQKEPNGLPEAFVLGANFLDGAGCTLILGDNLLAGAGVGRHLSTIMTRAGGTIFGAWMRDPRAYGVIEVDDNDRILSIAEKPERTDSHWAIPGLYVFDSRVVEFAKDLRPSKRGETEIVDLHNRYLSAGELNVEFLSRGTTWLDMGTIESLAQASDFVRTLEHRQGVVLGSPEEVAWRQGWISRDDLSRYAGSLGASSYCEYLKGLANQDPVPFELEQL